MTDTEPDPGSAPGGRGKLRKAAGAFRTISEVADELHIPQHVLRFWETKFVQVRPLKRGGGRRYYRPEDIALLRRVSDLLYIQGYTIKGVQRLLREGGGRLSDDIPPPDAAEQAAAETERARVAVTPEHEATAEPDLPMANLLRLDPSPRPAPTPARARPSEPEVERLRALLGRVLIDLEKLRARLP